MKKNDLRIVKAMKLALIESRAIPAINIPNIDSIFGIARASKRRSCPVIIQVSARVARGITPQLCKSMFDDVTSQMGGECYLHLDHCDDIELISKCVSLGWDMVMFDGSALPIEENINISRKVIEMAHQKGVAVEVEVGGVMGAEDDFESACGYPSWKEIEGLGRLTGADCIAIGFGNKHGHYITKSGLRWEIFERAYDLAGIPLVLHGATGLTKFEIKRAIAAGAAKINISTALKDKLRQVVTLSIYGKENSFEPFHMHNLLQDAAEDLTLDYIDIFSGSSEGLA